MQAQLVPPARVSRPDGRSLAATPLRVAALFSEGLGWVLAIGGIVLLRRAAFTRQVKWPLLAAVAITPKILFIGVRSLNAPAGISFPLNPGTWPPRRPWPWAWSISDWRHLGRTWYSCRRGRRTTRRHAAAASRGAVASDCRIGPGDDRGGRCHAARADGWLPPDR